METIEYSPTKKFYCKGESLDIYFEYRGEEWKAVDALCKYYSVLFPLFVNSQEDIVWIKQKLKGTMNQGYKRIKTINSSSGLTFTLMR